jgi:Uma2 family endonuclease
MARHDYAAAGISDYWIVDRESRIITVLTLDRVASVYREEAVVLAGKPWQAVRPFVVTVDPADFC